MQTHSFIMAVDADPHAADFEDRFFEAGLDDATCGVIGGVVVLVVSRAAPDRQTALRTVLDQVRAAGASPAGPASRA